MPAARKATPAVAASTRRIGSRRITSGRSACISIRCRVMSAKAEAAIPTSMWVRSPAARSLASRSRPITAQSAAAPTRRATTIGHGRARPPRNSSASIAPERARNGRRFHRRAFRGRLARRGGGGRAMRTMRIEALGQPLVPAEVPVPAPGPGEALLRVRACGLNFADTLMAAGRYQEKPALPFAPGLEVCGSVEALGPGVAGPAVGTRVAGLCDAGGLAEFVVLPAAACAPVPDGDGRRGGGRVPRRLRHQPHRAGAARAAPSRRDTAGHRRLGRGRADRGRDRRVARRPGRGRRARRGEAGGRGGGRRRGHARSGRRRRRGGEGARRRRRRLRDRRRGAVRRLPAGGEAGCAAAADRLRRRRGAADPGQPAAGQEPDGDRLLFRGWVRVNPAAARASLETLFAWHRLGRLRPHVGHVLPLAEANDGLELLRNRRATGKVVVRSCEAYSAAIRSARQ